VGFILVVGAIDIEIAIGIGIETRRSANGSRTRETGRLPLGDRRRYFEIARGSALECAAIQDVLVVGKALDETGSQCRKTELDRMAAMLSQLGGRGYQIREKTSGYDGNSIDTDPDSDSDLDETKPQQCGGGDGIPPPHR
jgi:hypothetical protein